MEEKEDDKGEILQVENCVERCLCLKSKVFRGVWQEKWMKLGNTICDDIERCEWLKTNCGAMMC